ncbi:hypothetical protein I4F81_008021 [Pyropia yezoensis]|uniref:Uncharacterized protein n=1 Tax=Pyropia yezoensis TaxID=2788 RepID=A0ACC3C675_PYRYE|nr:hypothetical protein I4F81_008021 [Neopyropia yezoensis]
MMQRWRGMGGRGGRGRESGGGEVKRRSKERRDEGGGMVWRRKGGNGEQRREGTSADVHRDPARWGRNIQWWLLERQGGVDGGSNIIVWLSQWDMKEAVHNRSWGSVRSARRR